MEIFSFDEWFNLFIVECRKMGYSDGFDKDSVRSDWSNGITPNLAAQSFVNKQVNN